jgi:hypothetical protein
VLDHLVDRQPHLFQLPWQVEVVIALLPAGAEPVGVAAVQAEIPISLVTARIRGMSSGRCGSSTATYPSRSHSKKVSASPSCHKTYGGPGRFQLEPVVGRTIKT